MKGMAMKVIRLQINNFLGVKAVDITPDGNVINTGMKLV